VLNNAAARGIMVFHTNNADKPPKDTYLQIYVADSTRADGPTDAKRVTLRLRLSPHRETADHAF